MKRDRKYLKTNFTGETYAREAVINHMLLQYKIEYRDAVYYTNILLEKKGTFLSQEEVNAKIQELEQANADYEQAHQDHYVGRPHSFKEQMGSLLNENFHITLLFLPILGIFMMSILPLIFSILIAFTNYSKGHQPPTQLFTWVGMQNFSFLFNPPADSIYKDLPATLGLTLSWTLIWAVAATFSNYILGIIVALMINKESIKLKKLWRTILVFSIAIPQFISILFVSNMFATDGIINGLFGTHIDFWGTDWLARITVIIVNIWIGVPYLMLVVTGILMNIPADLYESANIDGANGFQQYTKITLPYMLFITGPYLLTSFTGNMNNFNVIYLLTGGGPNVQEYFGNAGKTDLLITWLFNLAVNDSNYKLAAVIGIMVFIVVAGLSLIVYNIIPSTRNEEGFQ